MPRDESNESVSLPVEEPNPDTIRILLSTDNHLGYAERDPIRGMDSFAAFEEVLYTAKRFQCDLVLLAGDLFHENRPSRQTLHKTMHLLRKYCMGDRPVQLQHIGKNVSTDIINSSNNSKNNDNNARNDTDRRITALPTAAGGSPVLNYQDPYYSIDLPVFAIHGNHDDPVREGTGQAPLAALDLLAVTNLVNYVGKQDAIDQVRIAPILLRKGTTRVAFYSLGSMREERLHRMWKNGKVQFLRPPDDDDDFANNRRTKKRNHNANEEDDEEEEEEEEEYDDDDDGGGDDDERGFFNIFTLHQNRELGRGPKNCIQEAMIPEWIDLVVWGHEHECLIEFFESVVGTFRITQPGSSVATSLVAGEAARKKIGVLDIRGKQFRMHTVPLTQVRPFVTSQITLRELKNRGEHLDPDDPKVDERVANALQEEVRVLILQAREKYQETLGAAESAGNNAATANLTFRMEKPHQVLVRLRVDHSGFSMLNNQRFGAGFVADIANAEDILLFHRKKAPSASAAIQKATKAIPPEELARTDMDELVASMLGGADAKLKLLSEKKLAEALEEYVDKSLASSIDDAADEMLAKKQNFLYQRTADPKDNADVKSNDKSVDVSAQSENLDDRETEAQVPKTAEQGLASEWNKQSKRAVQSTRKSNKRPSAFGDGSAFASSGRDVIMFDDDGDDDDEADMPPISKRSAFPAKRSRAKEPALQPRTSRIATAHSQGKTEHRLKPNDSDSISDVEQLKQNASSRLRRKVRVNYNMQEDSDDCDDADPAVELDESDLGDDGHGDDDMLDDVQEEPVRKGKRTARAPTRRTAAGSQKAPANPRVRTSRSAPKHSFPDSDEEVDDFRPGSSIDLEDDWGTAETRSQF